MSDIRIDVAVTWYANPNLPRISERLPEHELTKFRDEAGIVAPDLSLRFRDKRLESLVFGEGGSTLLPDSILGQNLLEYHGCFLTLAPGQVQQQAKELLKKYFSLLDHYDNQSPDDCI